MPRSFSSRRRQHGVATILIVVFTGLALTAAVLTTTYRVRGAQEQSVALHAQTQAQIRAWTGAELVRQYIEGQGLDSFKTRLEEHFNTAEDGRNSIALSLQQSNGAPVPGISASLRLQNDTVWATITGTTQEGKRSEARAVLEIGYGASTSGNGDENNISINRCNPPQAAVMFHGDLRYTGGGLDIVNSSGQMVNVAIDGKLSVENASKAALSGCTKGDINLSGGGIASNANLWTEGKITISNMNGPRNVNLWAKEMELGWGSGTYGNIQAGAFIANVIDDATGVTVGTTVVGGELSPPPNSPLTLGGNRIIPFSSNTIIITLNDDNGRFRLALSEANIDTASGLVTPGAASSRLSGSGTLPARFYLNYKGVTGGTLSLQDATADTLWANQITLNGWNGKYRDARAFTSIRSNGTEFRHSLLVGGNYVAMGGNPNLSAGGNYRVGGTYQGSSKPPLLQTNSSPHPSPSLPGIPYCKVESQPVNVVPLRDIANYAFYLEGGRPMLRVQNVRHQDTGEALNRTYDLLSEDLRTIGGHDFLQCGEREGSGRGGHCFRNAASENKWQFLAYHFPPGIYWFDRNVTLTANSGNRPFRGAILTTGNVTLGNAGRDKNIRAPNHSTSAEICGARFYPANLCNNSGGTPAFTTWDDNGTTRIGNPIGNIAIMAEGVGEFLSDWVIRGAILLGRNIMVGGGTITINGTVLVGANSPQPNIIKEGGLKIVIDGLSSDQLYTPGSCTATEVTSPGEPGSTSVRIKWSRYL